MLKVTDAEEVRWIRFDRPEKLNALTLDDIRQGLDLVAHAPRHTRAIVFRGAGDRSFSSGVDVEQFRGLTPEGAREFISELKRFLDAVRTAPYITVCAVNGYCLGAAMELAMATDLRIAAETASFGMPEIAVGIPSVLDSALLQQHIGLTRAKEVLLTGWRYPAAELDRWGFLNAVAPGDELDATVRRFLDGTARHSTAAVAAQKRLFETWQNEPLGTSLEVSVDEFAGVFAEPETAEAVESYRARR
ncbi:MAG: enoyl-CoA hydratase [Streptosporangiales bacterium]|nr:enoyl-CoA hydratase [Streptosporangiales bacterium]